MSGKHVKLRAWRRGGGTPVRSLLLGGAAWVSVSAVLAVAVPGEPLAEHGADPALPSPSTLPEDPDRDPVVTRSVDRGGEARVLASPSADKTERAAVRSLVGDLTGVGEDLAATALTATAGATPSGTELPTDPSGQPSGASPDSPDPGPADDDGDDSGSGSGDDSGPKASGDPKPPEDDEPEEDDEPSDGPGPSLELPTVPPLPPIDLP